MSADATQNSDSSSVANVKLPPVDIPHFSGDFSAWISFRDLFKSSIDSNKGLSHVQKLTYLKSLVKGEAESLIRPISITDVNYQVAWNILLSHYDRKSLIVKRLLSRLFEMPTMASGKSSIRQFYSEANEIWSTMNQMSGYALKVDAWFIHVLSQKFDNETKREWANDSSGKEEPTIDDMLKFLQKTADIELFASNPKQSAKRVAHVVTPKGCYKCSKNHPLYVCEEFGKLPVEERQKLVSQLKICNNCFKKGHNSNECSSSRVCRVCQKRHHTLLHKERPLAINSAQQKSEVDLENNEPKAPVVNSLSCQVQSKSILPTCQVLIKNQLGSNLKCRILLDSGAQVNLISENCFRKLGLPKIHAKIPIQGISPSKVEYSKGKVTLNLSSKHDSGINLEIEALILSKLVEKQPDSHINLRSWNKLKNRSLADENFNSPHEVDLILGVDAFFSILGPHKEYLERDKLWLQETSFGWIIAGGIDSIENSHALSYTTPSEQENLMNETLKKFWEIEEPTKESLSLLTENEKACETHFLNNIKILNTGRLQVKLPFKNNNCILGNSKDPVLRQFFSLERKLGADADYKASYSEFMNEYKRLGHMVEVENYFLEKSSKFYYMPHHGIWQGEGAKRKLRVVFNASFKTTNNQSLNDNLHVGPNLQLNLLDILTNWRLNKYVFCTDICQMYRQILVYPEDSNYQLIFWRESPNDKLKVYKLLTLTYGTICAPYLAMKSLRHLAQLNKISHPRASKILETSTYMDDIFAGSDDISDLQSIRLELQQLLLTAGFKLRKWCSNNSEITQGIPEEDHVAPISIILSEDNSIKTLGLSWQPKKDIFHFRIELKNSINMTKRELISEVARIYDPFGWLSPVVLPLKVLFQESWCRKLKWDDVMPEDLRFRWVKIREELRLIEKIEIPRYFGTSGTLELHGFADASQLAYAAVIYLKIQSADFAQVRLLTSKTRVAPLKQVSIPRLELCAAQLLANIMAHYAGILRIDFSRCTCWSDSKTVLFWLASPPRRWKVFVANRVSEVNDKLPQVTWRYVKTNENPADPASRGLTPNEILESKLWWEGPSWLVDSAIRLSSTPDFTNVEPLEERTAKTIASVSKTSWIIDYVAKYSSWSKLRRHVAYLRKYLSYLKNQGSILNINLSHDDISLAEAAIIKSIQMSSFSSEINCLKNNKRIKVCSDMVRLSPFIDDQGLLRVGGRLHNSELNFRARHPILIPKDHLGKIIIAETHHNTFHGGVEVIVSTIREKFWIIGLKGMTKSCVRKCVTCLRYRGNVIRPKMGPLPEARVTISRPFLRTGVDFAGPILIKPVKGRGRSTIKGYITIFVCMATKSMHLELTMGLDADSFLMTFKRFISRRGICQQLWSDNGRNFVAADKEMKRTISDLLKDSPNYLKKYFSEMKTEWKFIPPGSPNFGGLWEAGVKLVKGHLKRVFNNHMLSVEEFTTALCQVEAILNSRPLAPSSEDISDLSILTPAHFLVLSPLTSTPDPLYLHEPSSLHQRFKLIQQIVKAFWNKWKSDYLNSLQIRQKWYKEAQPIEKGDLVLLKRSNDPPAFWLRGRIENLYPGADSITRVVDVRTQKGLSRESVANLVPLKLKLDSSTGGRMSE